MLFFLFFFTASWYFTVFSLLIQRNIKSVADLQNRNTGRVFVCHCSVEWNSDWMASTSSPLFALQSTLLALQTFLLLLVFVWPFLLVIWSDALLFELPAVVQLLFLVKLIILLDSSEVSTQAQNMSIHHCGQLLQDSFSPVQFKPFNFTVQQLHLFFYLRAT